MSRRLYIAASSTDAERARAEAFLSAAYDRGWLLSHDWMRLVAEHGGNPAESRASWAQWAREDLAGVALADAVVVLLPWDGSPARGAFAELGAAVAYGRPLVVVSSPSCQSIFEELGTVVGSFAEALEELERVAAEVAA
jgi:nucleoside 2-deoxyribosyltransferase